MTQARGRPRREGGRRFHYRRRVCYFCAEKVHIDYKNTEVLRRYISDRAKIEPRRRTNSCAKHQRALTVAIKRARNIALLPFSAEHLREARRAS